MSSPSIVPDQQQGSQTALEDFWNANHIDETNIYDSGNNGDSLFGHSKRMKTTGDSQSLFEAQEGEDAVLMDATMERDDRDESTELSTPPKKFEIVDDLDVNSVPWEDFEEEARSLSRLSTPSSIHSRQREFEREISAASADTSFSNIFLGLLFVPQISVSLKFFFTLLLSLMNLGDILNSL